MTQEENKVEEITMDSVIEPPKENNNSSPKWLIIAIVCLMIWAVWLWAYFYNFIEKKTDYDAPQVDGPKSFVQKQVDIWDLEQDTAFKGNLEFNLEVPTENSEFHMKLNDYSFISLDKWLKSQLSLGWLLFQVKERNSEEKVELNNIDIVTDEEVTYIRMEWEEIKNIFLDEFQWAPAKYRIFFDKLFSGEYIKVDNSAKLIKLLKQMMRW